MTTPKPVILVASDESPERARDYFERVHGDAFTVTAATSTDDARRIVRELKTGGQELALTVAEHAIGGESGEDLLRAAADAFPGSKRVLALPTADACPTPESASLGHVDFCVINPWVHPEIQLAPIVQNLLTEWQERFRPPSGGVRVIGDRWSREAHDVREFLARNRVPYTFLDYHRDAEARRLLEAAGAAHDALPLVTLPDGDVLARPSDRELAEHLGLGTRHVSDFYDLVVIGGGPAGLAAAVYASSEGVRTLVVEREAPGGQAGASARIENYLGFPAGLSGADLVQRAVEQARRFGVELLVGTAVESVRPDGAYHVITLDEDREITCHAIVVATGAEYRRLEVPNADRLTGTGVYYGAVTAEATDFRDRDLIVLGGGNSAGQAAMLLSQYARRVTMIARGESLGKSMAQYLVERIGETPNIDVRLHATITAVEGDGTLERVRVMDGETGKDEELPCDALFVFIGATPRTEWLEGLVQRDEDGFIRTGRDLDPHANGAPAWPLKRDPFLLETNVPGIFVAGDVRSHSVKRIASAVGEGAMVVQFVHAFLRDR